MQIGEKIPEEVIITLQSHGKLLVAYVIEGLEDSPIFEDIELAKRYATINKLRQRLGYAIITRLLISPSTSYYPDEDLTERGEIVDREEFMKFDKQLNVWKK